LGYNPRCLKRDVGPYPSEKWCNYTRVHGKNEFPSFKIGMLIKGINSFDDASKDHCRLSIRPRRPAGDRRPWSPRGRSFHDWVRYLHRCAQAETDNLSGDPGGDLFTSPGDPAFFLHHGMVDRLWTLW
jgi:tyrosinase